MQKILERRVMPVAVVERADDAVPMAEALLAAGLDVLEITYRTGAAAAAIRAVAQRFPEMLVGAGTILTTAQLEEAISAGAQFGVAPGLNAKVVGHAAQKGVPFVPGVMTPSEVELGLELGCKLLKFFPAEQAGGVAGLKALAGPYAHTGVKFLPLGGVNAGNAAQYLALPIVGAIGGSWLVDKQLLADKNWAEIKRRTAEVLAIARAAR